MLDQVLLTWTFCLDCFNQLSGDTQLVEAREKHPVDFVLLVALGCQVAAKDFQPAFAFPDLFPEVSRLMAITQWIALAAVFATWIAAFIEREEEGLEALELCGHLHFPVADGEMNQRSAREAQQRFWLLACWLGVPVFFVLIDRVINGLGVVGLELNGGNRDAVEEEDEINAVLVVERVLDLPSNPKSVGLVALEDFFVEAQGWLELRQLQVTT